ncbi:urease subunit gamma [Streptomyces anulatus]|uniref:urease subunit gamma n=1 Tax=Streptomyces anulatus TaxID=1892 RepID=UPI00255C4DEE|nr:urease subunit gamma [Streptomyces anulatus]WIY79552.1 urease subunit gamma [Streptomyces anulatus]
MHLTPHEQERLMMHVAADVAEKRRSRGVLLNYPEAMALLIVHVLEGARDGRTVAELMSSGRKVLSREEVMEGIPEMIENVQVEATFPDGTKLVTIHGPFPEAGRDEEPLTCPGKVDFSPAKEDEVVIFNERNRQLGQVTELMVANPTDRPIQVGSHYHFAEANDGLEFVRKEAWGRRLNVPAGSSVRFEPGITEKVQLVPIEGPGWSTVCAAGSRACPRRSTARSTRSRVRSSRSRCECRECHRSVPRLHLLPGRADGVRSVDATGLRGPFRADDP